MGQPITTNPLLIMLINMTVVFGVLWLLGILIRLIRYIDPTRKKSAAGDLKEQNLVEAVVVTEPADDPDELVAVITAALAAQGYGNARIASIRPLRRRVWTQAARIDALRGR